MSVDNHAWNIPVTRRELLGATVALGTRPFDSQTSSAPADDKLIERVPLGKTGLKVTRLMAGGSFSGYGPRLLEFTYRRGVRSFDSGDFYAGYKAEAMLGEWINRTRRRKDVIIINKARTIDPKKFVDRLHEALEKMKIDTIDVFMFHSIADPEVVLDRDGRWRKLKDRFIREKKIRFMGLSTHAAMPARIACLNNAAKSGWIDVVMPACDMGMIRNNAELNKALDACAKAGIGMVAIKCMRGLGKAAKQPEKAREAFKNMGMSPHVAMLIGTLSDGRFASVCTEMPNRKIIEENCAAARAFRKPFDARQWKQLDEGMKLLSRATCSGCDGSCQRAAGTQTDFCSIARYLAYYEEDGKRDLARTLYNQLPPHRRDWQGADLKAASSACTSRLDFESILARAEKLLVERSA